MTSGAARARMADAARLAWADPAQRAQRVAAIRARLQTPESRRRRSLVSRAAEERRRALRAWVTRLEAELFPPDEAFTPRARRAVVRVLGEFYTAIVGA